MTESDDNADTSKTHIVESEWMIRPCKVYKEEYEDCVTVKARFHQYFIFGKTLDCSQWKRDHDNCSRWQERRDLKSANELIQSEKKRRRERLQGHYGNTVWSQRKTPPENWNTPLPEHIQKEYEASYLNIKSKEMKGELPPTKDIFNYCVLM